ncbi:MAG: right-handed parallel beta-helix repeat-containing protein [Thermoplasmata archaeon]|nr:MAG: right-handed parallel beta-helix repeat-containing protein [Thermoplasmata archaeon]
MDASMNVSGKLRVSTLFIILLMLASISFPNLMNFSQKVHGEGSGDFPPPSNGDWVITVDTTVQNENLTVEGNITIEEGAKLTLDNVILLINASNYGEAKISVKNGGELKIINNSLIMEGTTGVNYDFIFENGSKGLIQESTIKNSGWNDGGTWQSTGGILIMSDDVVVENSTIQNNYMGCVIVSSSPIIRYNTISDNIKYGILLLNGSGEIIGNNISYNPVGVYSLYSDFSLSENNIRDNGDGLRLSYSSIYMNGGNITSNDRDDCTTGACSSQETGKGMLLYYSNISMSKVFISDNTDDGLMAYYTLMEIQNSTFADNPNGILGQNSEIILKNNIFSNNQFYGINWMYSPLDLDDSNMFIENNGEGRVLLEWDVSIDIIDSYGDWVPHADLEFKGNGTNYTTVGMMGIASRSIAEYTISNDGTYIDHNPYTIIASETADWDDVRYSSSTVIQIGENIELNMTIPLKKPDLQVDKVSFSQEPKMGKKINIKVEVSNIGEASVNEAEIVVTQKDSLGKSTIINKTNVSLNPNQSLELQIAWNPEHEGDTQITAEIETSFDEKDKENNELEISVDVQEKDLPLYEEPYFIAGLISFLFILIGVGIYLMALRKETGKE